MALKLIWNVGDINILLHKWNNFFLNQVLYKNMNEKEKEILKNNSQYKGKYKGKRCFIIGNGPSVNQLDFGVLKNELVITVNEMFRHNDFLKLNSNFHFIADPNYLKLNKANKADQETIEKMLALKKSKTTLFMPIESVNAVKRYGWNGKLDISYYSSNLYFYDGYKDKIDFTKFIPCFQAVIQWCIVFAVYMGCSEICLLGCDGTNIVTDISLFMERSNKLAYAYSLSEETTKIIQKKHISLGLENTLLGYWRIVHLFGELARYCERNGINIYNCSGNTILENIPKRKIEEVLRTY